MKTVARVPARVAMRQPYRYWMVYVPVDGAPVKSSHATHLAVQAEIQSLIGRRAEGWVYTFEGEHHEFHAASSDVIAVGRSSHCVVNGKGPADMLPGTELVGVETE